MFRAHRPSGKAPQLTPSSALRPSQGCSAYLKPFSPSLICMVSVCSFHQFLSWRQQPNNTSLIFDCICAMYWPLFSVVLLFFLNRSYHGHRMTQIGNTISGVTGLRSVWWMLVTLSPSLLTPGSKCMHGRSELNSQHKLYLHLFPFPTLFVSFTLILNHAELLSPCTQTSPLCLKI